MNSYQSIRYEEESNEDLEKRVKAKVELDEKKLVAKLARDKNPVVSQLRYDEETQEQTNKEFEFKLNTELKKHDDLLGELIQLKENFKLTKEKFEQKQTQKAEQDEQIKELQDKIGAAQKATEEKLSVVEEKRKVNAFEIEKRNKYAKANAALRAKLEFIEANYDYSSTAKQMSIQDFKELISSNLNVNSTIEGFTGKLELVQKELQQIETMKIIMQ